MLCPTSRLIVICSRAIRMNILINPTGHPGKFRAVDWAVELLNLFTKVRPTFMLIGSNIHTRQVTYSGKFSNRSIEHILNESPLVETYRYLHEVFSESFCVSKKTTSHHSPGMEKTYMELLNAIERENTHTMVTGRGSNLDAGSLTNKGILSIVTAGKSTTTEEMMEAESEDVELEIAEEEVDFDAEDLMLDVD